MNMPLTRTILVADPSSLRRDMILRACADHPVLRGHGASSIRELYRQTEELRPTYVALAAEFAQMRESDALASLFDMIGAKVAVYGDIPVSGSPYRCFRVIGPDDAARFVSSFTPRGTAATERPMSPPGPVPSPVRSTGSVAAAVAARSPANQPDIIAIGGSTGAIVAIEKILSVFPEDCPPTLIVQHIRPGFAEGLVRRLDGLVAPKVVAASDGGALQRGTVYVATESDRHLGVITRAGLRTRLFEAPDVSGHKPSIDVLFDSLAELGKHHRIAACLLTGMGADGADGMSNLRAKDAFTIAQDKETSVVWGMPQAAIQRGGATVVLPIDRIGPTLLSRGAAPIRPEGCAK